MRNIFILALILNTISCTDHCFDNDVNVGEIVIEGLDIYCKAIINGEDDYTEKWLAGASLRKTQYSFSRLQAVRSKENDPTFIVDILTLRIPDALLVEGNQIKVYKYDSQLDEKNLKKCDAIQYPYEYDAPIASYEINESCGNNYLIIDELTDEYAIGRFNLSFIRKPNQPIEIPRPDRLSFNDGHFRAVRN